MQDFAAAITRFEGTCPSPDSCQNNNPGNLRAGPGATGTDSRGIAIFPDYTTGEAALEHQIGLNIDRGLTLQQFFTGLPGVYAGYDKTAPNYTSTVAGWLSIDPNAPLSQVIGSGPSQGDFGASSPDAPDAPFDMGGGDGSGISTTALLALGIAAAGLLAGVLD